MNNKKDRDQAIEELTLMLMYLTRFSDNNEDARYREISWKGYDFDVLNRLDEKNLIYSPRGKVSYFSEEGRMQAQKLLQEYNLKDYDFFERYEFRNIREDEVEIAAQIEAICFPPKEACSLEIMRERVRVASDCFLVVIDRNQQKMIGFINGLCSDDYELKDELYTDTGLHNPDGKNVMICGVDVLPEYRKQGIARQMVWEFLRKQQAAGRKKAILTCVSSKVKMYKKLGFTDRGLSSSKWGGEKWHQMECLLNF